MTAIVAALVAGLTFWSGLFAASLLVRRPAKRDGRAPVIDIRMAHAGVARARSSRVAHGRSR